MRRPSLSTVHIGAIAVFALLAVIQLVSMLMGNPGAGFTAYYFPVLGLVVGLWASAAVGLFLRQPWGYFIGLVAAVTAICHGAILRLGSDPLGIVILLLGVASFALVVSDRRVMGFQVARTSLDRVRLRGSASTR